MLAVTECQFALAEDYWCFISATDAILLPQAKPGIVREQLIVSPIPSRESLALRGLASGAAKMRSSHSISAVIRSMSIRASV